MVTLQQRLRELGKETFEFFVHQLLLKKYPGADIKKSEGSGGDQGIDSFSGDLSDGPSIWQCKHFPDRIRQAQKRQILRSVEIAFKSHRPKRWTLCVPIDLRTEEHKWFQAEVINRYKGLATIELMGAAEMLEELISNRPLRDAIFEDNSISNALSLRQIALGTGSRSLQQREQLTVEMAQQFLEGNLDLEPRLQPIMTIGLSCPPYRNGSMAGSVFSVRRGPMAIDYIPRDPTSYKLDPLSLQVTLSRTYSNKLQKSIDTGLPFKFPAGAILKLDSESPLLRHLLRTHDPTQLEMEIRPEVPAGFVAKEHPMRFLTGSPVGSIELSYVPFKVTQFGRKEIVLLSCSRLPIEISIRLETPPNPGANITIRALIPGADAIDLSKVFEFLHGLERTGNLEVLSFDPPGPLFSEVGRFSNKLKISAKLKKIVSDAALISSYFQVPLRIPDEITQHDLHKIQTLKQIATGEAMTEMVISANLIKESMYADNAIKFLSGTPMLTRMENPTGWEKIELFGQTIDSGPIALTAKDVTILDGEATLKKYLDAPEGAAIDWKGVCNGECRFVASTSPQEADAGLWSFLSETTEGDSQI